MYSRRVAGAVVVIACAASVTALAASSYSVRVRASSQVVSGHSFRITARGVAKQRALLYFYLDRKACPAGSNKAAQRDGAYSSGQSYFVQKRGGHTVNETWDYAWVSGSFKKSYTAHAGTADGREYACAYLDTKNKYGGYRITVARASTGYTVTK